jgi:SNF2 family DNA or RNA helicase
MIEFRDYQKDIISRGTEVLQKNGFLYLAMEVRTGKTLTSLGIADKMGVEHVLFLTKKKAISSIVGDYDLMCPASFILFTINYESMHKLPQNIKWDIVVIDEAHSLGAIPKPNKRAKDVKALIKKNKSKVILMSGTPTPESYSQMYHQVYGIPNNPFSSYVNFYKFSKQYVDVKQRKINSLYINDYSRGLETIVDKMNPYTIRFTQKEAGFENDIVEEVLEVEMEKLTYKLISKLKKDLVVEGNEDVILADTPVKLMMKLHQLCGGTIKFESGNSMIIDFSKAQFIYDNFCLTKIGIFYKFKEELNALKKVYGSQLCTEIDEFNSTDKTIALQIVSGREGISLRNAEYLVYYNIDFSATSYWQSRDRMTTKDSTLSKVYWVFAKDGIEKEIYKAVVQKKDYTLKHFKKDLLTLN